MPPYRSTTSFPLSPPAGVHLRCARGKGGANRSRGSVAMGGAGAGKGDKLGVVGGDIQHAPDSAAGYRGRRGGAAIRRA